MKRYNIRNLDDLLAHKRELKLDYVAKENLLKADAKTYVKQFTFGSLIKKYASPNNFFKIDDKLNISSTIMSLLLPTVMNKTVFKSAGFLTKALVGFASGKVGKSLDIEHMSAIFNSVKGWLSGIGKSKKKEKFVDYGIPPDSETF
jgi:hypothetical protein